MKEFQFVCGDVVQVRLSFLPQSSHVFARPVGAVVAPQQVFFHNIQFQAGHQIELKPVQVMIADVVQSAHKIGTAPKKCSGPVTVDGSYVQS